MNLTRHIANAFSLIGWKAWRRSRGWPLVRVVGDSHVKAFAGNVGFIVHHVGPATAYNLKEEESTTGSRQKLFAVARKSNAATDVVLLVFGEVDCRLHIYNQYMKRNGLVSMEALIDETIARYGSVMEELRAKGVRFGVLGPPPATRQGNRYKVAFYATPEIHRVIYARFNERLRAYCETHGHKFMDIYSKTADSTGFPRPEYAADHTHLNRKAMTFVEEWIAAEFATPSGAARTTVT